MSSSFAHGLSVEEKLGILPSRTDSTQSQNLYILVRGELRIFGVILVRALPVDMYST